MGLGVVAIAARLRFLAAVTLVVRFAHHVGRNDLGVTLVFLADLTTTLCHELLLLSSVSEAHEGICFSATLSGFLRSLESLNEGVRQSQAGNCRLVINVRG